MSDGLDGLKVIQLLGSAGGITTLKSVLEQANKRDPLYEKVKNAYQPDRFFRNKWFWGFLYLVSWLIRLVSVILIIAAILVALSLFLPDLLGRVGDEAALNKLGWGGTILFLLSLLVLSFEPNISLETFRHWLRERNLERALANRIKRGDEGYFRVQDENCAELARAMAVKLREDPEYLSRMLIADRPNDRSTLCNELFIGEIFEALMPEEFSPDWQKFRPVQNCTTAEGLPVCSPQVILKKEPEQLVDTLQKAISPTKMSIILRRDLATCLVQLRQEWQGNALELLSPPRPRPSRVLYLCLVVIVPALLAAMFQWVRGLPISPWGLTSPFDKFYLGLWLLAVGCAAALVLKDLRVWREWIAIRLRLRTAFETILRRLASFPVFKEHEGARVALAKFAYEYKLLNVSPKELQLGSSLHVVLSLIKTKAMFFSEEKLLAADPDLWFFCERAMRRIADYLEDLLVTEGGFNRAQLVGEQLPYNIVDGFLYVVGHDHCKQNSCGTAQDCPFYKTGLCDSMQTKGFVYDRNGRLLKLEDN